MSSSLRLAAIISILFFSVTNVFALPFKRAQSCNGHAELCDRPYGNTTFLGSHDSFAFSGNPFALARTQEVDLDTQLKLGVRLLQAQSHMNGKELHFCHTTCGLFDGGPVKSYLQKVKGFLDKNPNEVMTFIFTNPENVSLSDVWKPIFDQTGFTDMAYVPPQPVMSRNDWPTLGEMIGSGKRVVIFLDKGAENSTDPAVNFILPQFKMVWEDVYDPTNPKFPCKVDRTAGPLPPDQQLSLINHNLNANILPIPVGPRGRGVLIPDRLNTPKTNGVKSILSHSEHCATYTNDGAPNFVLLDYVNVGQGMKAVDRLNGF